MRGKEKQVILAGGKQKKNTKKKPQQLLKNEIVWNLKLGFVGHGKR